MTKKMLGEKNIQNVQNIQNKNQKDTPCAKGRVSKNVAVVLPAYNEEEAIGTIALLSRLHANEIIVVDDGSKDKTSEIARLAGADVIVHEKNLGKARALETGFKAAVEKGADIIVMMDSDGQHNPADIPELVAPILAGNAEVVNGSRYLNEFGKSARIYRRITQGLFDKLTNANSSLKITDPEGSFRAFSTASKGIFGLNVQNVVLDNEILENAEKAGIRIAEVEIGVSYNAKYQSRDPIKYLVESVQTLVKDIEVNKPLYYYSVPGFGLATCALYMGFRFLGDFLQGIENLQFGPAVIMIILALAGISMTVRGIVMHSLAEVTAPMETG
ncbi:MAG: glycosyltransferase family 2 protein [Methanosarcina sp.]